MKAHFTATLFLLLTTITLFTGCSKKSTEPNVIDPPPTEETDFFTMITTPDYVECATTDPSGGLWIGTYTGVYKSTNKGTTWQQIPNTGITTTTKVTQIKSAPNGKIYIVSGTDLYAYETSTLSWVNISQKMNTSLISFDHMYTFSVDKNGVVYAGMFISQKPDAYTIGVDKPVLYKSPTSGQSWTEVKVTNFMGRVQDIAFGSSGIIYVIMDAAVYHSLDNGATWSKGSNGIVSANPLQLAVNSKGAVYAATGTGVFTSTDNGVNWNNLNYTNYDYTIGINSLDRIIVGSTNRTYVTNDNGGHWTEQSSGLSYNYFDHAYIWAVDKDGYAYVSLKSVLYRTTHPTTL